MCFSEWYFFLNERRNRRSKQKSCPVSHFRQMNLGNYTETINVKQITCTGIKITPLSIPEMQNLKKKVLTLNLHLKE
jgi:hypothetical protein